MTSILMRSGAQRWVAGAIALSCLTILWFAMDLDWGSATRPGPGFFPQLLAGLGALLAGGAALLAKPAPIAISRQGALPFTIALIAFCMLLQPLGFILAGMLFSGWLAHLLGADRLWKIAAVAVPTPVVLYLIFVHAFQINLPAGMLGGLI